jgi:hypothetical protein
MSGLPSQSVCSHHRLVSGQQSSASPDELRGARKTRDDGMSWLPSQQSSACPGELRGARKTRDDSLSGLPSQSVCSHHRLVSGQQSSASPDELRGARKTRDDGLSGLPSQSVCSHHRLVSGPVRRPPILRQKSRHFSSPICRVLTGQPVQGV